MISYTHVVEAVVFFELVVFSCFDRTRTYHSDILGIHRVSLI